MSNTRESHKNVVAPFGFIEAPFLICASCRRLFRDVKTEGKQHLRHRTLTVDDLCGTEARKAIVPFESKWFFLLQDFSVSHSLYLKKKIYHSRRESTSPRPACPASLKTAISSMCTVLIGWICAERKLWKWRRVWPSPRQFRRRDWGRLRSSFRRFRQLRGGKGWCDRLERLWKIPKLASIPYICQILSQSKRMEGRKCWCRKIAA